MDIQYTNYFENYVLAKRPYIKKEWCENALCNPTKIETQDIDGRIRHWIWVEELGKYIRVVTLPDGKTIHNAFPDRGFKP